MRKRSGAAPSTVVTVRSRRCSRRPKSQSGQQFFGLGDDGVDISVSRRAATAPDPRRPRRPTSTVARCPAIARDSSGSFGQRRVRGDQVDGLALVVVVGGTQQPPVMFVDRQVAQFPDPVEPADVDLQQRPAQSGVAAAAPPPQQLGAQRLRAGDKAVDPARPGRRRRDRRATHRDRARARAYSSATATVEQRLVEVVEPHVAGQVGDHPLAALDGRQTVKPGPHLGVGQLRQLGLVAEPALEDRGHRRYQLVDPAERAEHPDDGFFEFGGAIQPAHAVAQQRSLQPPPVRVGQAGPIRVQPLQVGQQVLLGAAGDERLLRLRSRCAAGRASRRRRTDPAGCPRSAAVRCRPAQRSRRAGAAGSALHCTEPGSRS